MKIALRAKAKARLPNLPAETLADALIELAEFSKEAEAVIEQLCIRNDEAIATFKRKLTGIKRRKSFYFRSQARSLAIELESLLELLNKPDLPAKDALEALVSFFKSDSKIMEMADDSNGDMGTVFCVDATKLFAKIAARIDDQPYLIKTFKKLYADNDYGVRDTIVEHAAEFLSQESMEALYQHYAHTEPKNDLDFQPRILASDLSAQLKNPEQFEAELRRQSPHLSRANVIELAGVYQAAERYADLIDRLPEFYDLVEEYERVQLNDIAVDAYRHTGDLEAAKSIRIREFFNHPSVEKSEAVAEFADEAEVAKLVEESYQQALSDPELRLSRIEFFQQSGQHLMANQYLIDRRDQLNGNHYTQLVPLAKTFETAGYPLASALIWRALIDSILARAQNTAYIYAARYLSTLHRLDPKIDSWLDHPDHPAYLQQLHADHRRKTSFWRRVPAEIQKIAERKD